MEPVAKITISPEELARMQDTAFLVSKRLITEKVYDLFHQLKNEINSSPIFTHFSFPEGVDTVAGKISRGENYRGLPYVVMDFPQAFGTDGVFAFRAMYWWGHEFSFSLHLSGKYMKRASERPLTELHDKEVYRSVNASPWEYHFDADNYEPIETAQITSSDFIKLSRKLSLSDWDKIPAYGAESLELYLKWLR